MADFTALKIEILIVETSLHTDKKKKKKKARYKKIFIVCITTNVRIDTQ